VIGLASGRIGAAPINIEMKTSSNGGQAETSLSLIPAWSDRCNSRIGITLLEDSSIGPALDSDPKSLLASQNSTWKTSLTLLEGKAELIPGRFALGASLGAEWWNEDELEQGYFAFGGDAQLMANSTRINYFLPVIGAAVELKLLQASLRNAAWYSPFFYYLLDQTVAIQPLVDGQFSQSVGGWGKTIFVNQLDLSILSWLDFGWYFNLTLLEFPFLKLGVKDNSPTFYQQSNPARSIENRITAGIRIPFGEKVSMNVRAGKNFIISTDLENDISVEDDYFVWEASLSLR
jgi:hypothetical protein